MHDGKIAYIGLGSNLEHPKLQLIKALDLLKNARGISLLQCSSVYRSAAVGFTAQPSFLNAVARLSTRLSPLTLLRRLQSIEYRQGRIRTGNRNAPRTLDLDLLMYAGRAFSTDALTVPHPRMHQRRFVLMPLLEISPAIRIPGKGRASRLLQAVSGQDCRLIGTIPG